jgi:hypothetical protein
MISAEVTTRPTDRMQSKQLLHTVRNGCALCCALQHGNKH